MFGNCGNRIVYVYPQPPKDDCYKEPPKKVTSNCGCSNYAEPKVILRLDSPMEYENGETVSSLNFSWVYNKPAGTLESQDINGWQIDPSLRKVNVTTNLTQDTVYTITVSDGSRIATDSVAVRFKDYIYCGVGKTQPVKMQKVDSCKVSFPAGEGEYIWIFVPSSTGITKFLFDHNVDVVSDFKSQNYSFTNNAGKTVDGILYRSVNYSLGMLTLKFK